MRTALFVTRVITFIAVCSVAAFPTNAQQNSDDVVRVDTALVQTDFMVFDKQGNFIDGLKRDQFVLKVEGKAHDIAFFDRIAAGSRNEEAQLAAARGNQASTDTKAPAIPPDRGRTVMFFIDDMHLSVGSMNQARVMLRKFVESEMGQNDQSAIVTASGQLGFLQQLTNNREVMLTAIDRLKMQQHLMLQSAERPPMTEYNALSIQDGNSDVFNYFVDQIIKETKLPRIVVEQMVRSRARQIMEDSAVVTGRSLDAFKSFVENTATLPGRKLIFFVSDGFYLSRNHEDNANRIQSIAGSAARAGTVVYSIDARGLTAGLPDASAPVTFDPTNRLGRGAIGEIRASQDGLNALANDSGGRAFFNINSLSVPVNRALKETSIYYLLAWRPDNEEQRTAKFHHLEVSIVDRPELVVRFRSGFGASPDEAAKRNKESQTRVVPKTPTEELNRALLALYPLTALPVSISLTFLDSAQDGGTLTTSIKVGTSSLALEPRGDTPTAVLDMAGLVLNDQGKSVSDFNERFTIRATADNPKGKPPEVIIYNHVALIKPGLYQVRVAAIDVKTGRRGSAIEWIEIPNVANKELTLSSLIAGENKPESGVEPVVSNSKEPPQPAALKQVTVNVDHHFASSSSLRFVTIIYNATGGATPDLAAQVQIFRDNEPVITAPLHKIQTEGAPDMQRVPYAADVSLSGLRPGAYVLQVTVIDRLAKASATQKLSFQID